MSEKEEKINLSEDQMSLNDTSELNLPCNGATSEAVAVEFQLGGVMSQSDDASHSQSVHSPSVSPILSPSTEKGDVDKTEELPVSGKGDPGLVLPDSSEGDLRSTTRSTASKRSNSGSTKKGESNGKTTNSRSDSLSRKEREEKVRETRERMEKEKEKKLQELLEAQKTAEELRSKQQEIRKKRMEDLKSKDGERQRAAEERRKRRELDDEERKRNFLRKRLERANKAEGEARLKKGKHESFGFGSSAPRFEDIILTSSPGTRSMSQLNLSAMRKSATSGDEADQDSPRPGSATPGDGHSPRNATSETSAMYIARPLSKSTTNIASARRAPDASARRRRISANTSLSNSEGVEHSPITRAKSTELPDNLKKSVARLSVARSLQTEPLDRSKSKPSLSADSSKKPAVGITDTKPRPKPASDLMTKSASSDTDSRLSVKSSLKTRSSSATRNSSLTKSVEEPSFESRSKTLDRPSKAQRAAKAEAMSKARSVGNISRAHLSTKKEGDTAKQAPTRAPLAKSKSTDPVKPAAPRKTSTPNKVASAKPAPPAGKPATTTGKPVASASKGKPTQKTATAAGSRRASKDSNSTASPKGTRSTTPTAETVIKSEDTNAAAVVDTTAEKTGETEKATEGEVVAAPVTAPSPKEDTKKSAKAAEMEEYKAKLAEKRREAREKAEKEAEEERQRQEQERLAEEQRQHEEEERQREFEMEQNRLMAEARQQEQERLEKAIEEEERRRKEEAERAESERLAKEEAAEKSRLDAEKREKEKQERIAKEEQEKLERKKKLEMIMKRVKTGSPTPDRPQAASEPASLSTSMTGSMTSSSPAPSTTSGAFKSPLLQGLMANKSASETTPEKKFSSPLLNNLMAKVSADRSEDNSSNSSPSNTPTSQPNSSQTSPEHKNAAPHHSSTENAELSVKVEGDNTAFFMYLKEDSSTNLSDNLSDQETANHGLQLIDSANELQAGEASQNTSSVNGNTSRKVIVENGTATSVQNGISHSLQQNGAQQSAGLPDEERTAFEEVLSLSSKQSQVPSTNPAPIIAFDDSSAHTEEVH